MNEIFVKNIKEKFTNQFTIETDEEGEFIKFFAKNTDFGDVIIYQESFNKYIIVLGKFTHTHFDIEGTPNDETIKKTVINMIHFLEELFTDHIVCFGSHESSGGYAELSEIEDLCNKKDELFVWSGKYKKFQNN